MASSKFVDIPAIVQVIGCVFKSPQLLDYTDKYTITEDDFPDEFHQIIFGTIYKLHELGAERITLNSIIDYLSTRPKYEALFIKQKGEEWITKATENANTSSFDYYYNRMKKMTLLRAFDEHGIDVRDIYDPDNIIDLKLRQKQEDFLDNTSVDGLAQIVQDRIDEIKADYVDGSWGEAYHASDGLENLLNELEQ